jgi:hypothetical protein
VTTIPSYSDTDAGKVLAVNPPGTGLTWKEVSGGITTETDPVFSASPAAAITTEDIAAWDAKQDTLTAGTNITIENNVISASGGGGNSYVWTDSVFTPTQNTAAYYTDWLTALQNGLVYEYIKVDGKYYHIAQVPTKTTRTSYYIYTTFPFTNYQPISVLQVEVSANSGSVTGVYVDYGDNMKIGSDYIKVTYRYSVTNADSYASENFKYIRDNYALKSEIPTAQANAATALYLKDTNNVVYQITVGTDGTLSATAE